MRAVAAGLLAALSGPVTALAQPIYDPGILTACLAAGGDQRAACIGTGAASCMQGEAGDTTVGMSGCLYDEEQQWDGLLNAAYGRVMADAENTDAEMKALGSAAPPQAPALREMQRSWIKYRDSACAYEETRWGGGSGGGPAATQCRMELTARQALRLIGYAEAMR